MADETLAMTPLPDSAPRPSFREATATFLRIGVLSFGGPTAQIALMHRVLVEEKKWLDERTYLSALSFCMLLPGPEAMQLATYAGWRLHGFAGGLAAGLLFVLPGAAVVLAFAMLYASFGNVPVVAALFLGIKAAVLVIVVEALHRVSARALRRQAQWVIAALSFVLIFFFAVPFPLIVLAAGLYGYFHVRADTPVNAPPQVSAKPWDTFATVALWLGLWLVPLLAVWLVFGGEHVLSRMSVFFSKLAVVTFGGAYAVLAYMGQDVVSRFGWLDAGAMMDGLGLAETTPGPLILVTEFVGYLVGYRHGGEPAVLMGVLGALVALWATFAPCFLWIFAGAPYIDWLTHQPRLRGALDAITAAVVGVILNLAVWFALHVVFKEVALVEAGPLKLWTPDPGSLDGYAVVLAGLSAVLLLRMRWSVPAVLTAASTVSLGLATMGF